MKAVEIPGARDAVDAALLVSSQGPGAALRGRSGMSSSSNWSRTGEQSSMASKRRSEWLAAVLPAPRCGQKMCKERLKKSRAVLRWSDRLLSGDRMSQQSARELEPTGASSGPPEKQGTR